MNRQEAREIVDRFNCDLAGTDLSIDSVIDALSTTDYGDGTPSAEELAQIREALEFLYPEQETD